MVNGFNSRKGFILDDDEAWKMARQYNIIADNMCLPGAGPEATACTLGPSAGHGKPDTGYRSLRQRRLIVRSHYHIRPLLNPSHPRFLLNSTLGVTFSDLTRVDFDPQVSLFTFTFHFRS